MWGSVLVGDEYDVGDVIGSIDDPLVRTITKDLAQHPLLKEHAGGLVNIIINLKPKGKDEKAEIEEDEDKEEKSYPAFSRTGEGWFETHLGSSADGIVSRLRKARRSNKEFKEDIDILIRSVRELKSLEVQATIDSMPWLSEREDTIRELGLSDRDLKSLRCYGDSRSDSLLAACEMWDNASLILDSLEKHEGGWDDSHREQWAKAMDARSGARKSWRSTLHQSDRLSKAELELMGYAVEELQKWGPLNAKSIISNLTERNVLKKTFRWSNTRVGRMLNMYGEEFNIVKAAGNRMYGLLVDEGILIKDPWAYGAGFLDADGYITITKRGEPRAGFIATGSRGRTHCEQIQKNVGCGILQLDQKVYKDGQRSQHRVTFYSKADLRKLLEGVGPFLRLKNIQAQAVLKFLDEKDPQVKENLRKVVQYHNWADDKKKSRALLDEWGIGVETVVKWAEEL